MLPQSDIEKLMKGIVEGPMSPSMGLERLLQLVGWFAQYYLNGEDYQARAIDHCMSYPPDAVVVLSGPWDESGDVPKVDSLENIKRIAFAAWFREVIAPGRTTHTPFVLNGETEQLPWMFEEALKHVREDDIVLVDCGARGIANTATQFDVLAPLGYKRLVTGTTDYHVARAFLTALERLPGANCTVVGVPYSEFPFDVTTTLIGEFRRILEYADRGDIASERELQMLFPCPVG